GTVTVDGSGNWTYALDNSNATAQALAAGDTLADTITFTSDDGTTQTQAITITGANDAAVIGGDASAAVSEDGTLTDSGALTISDADSGEAVFLVQSSAASTNGYGTVDLDSAGNWTYNLDNSNATVQALAEGQTLTDSFTATSADGATQVVTVTITGKDDTALISGGTNFSGNEGDSTTGNLNATDLEGLTDGTYYTVTAQATNGTASINPETGVWSFTPANGDWFGTDRFTVTVTDDKGGTTQQVISIVLANVNDAPVSKPVTLTPIAEDSGARVITQAELLANSNDVDGDTLKVNGLSVSSGSGRLVENNDGTWSFTPSTNWNGEVSFSFDVSDGTTAQASSAILAVSPVNDAPVEEGVSSEPVVYPSVQIPIPEPELDVDQELASKPTPETRSESDGAEGTESGPVPLDDQSDITASDLQYLSPIDDVALAESLTEVYVVTETYDYANDQHELPPPKTLDLLNLNLTPFQAQGMSAVEMVSPIKNSSFAGELDDMKRELDEVATEQSKQAKFRTEAMVGATMGLSVGFISWVLRAGSLMAGFMSVTPLWRQLDPMPILGADDDKGQEKESEREAKEDGRKVEEIFADDDPDH
uniref:VCBS domain-containing protein n=1 Tax=Marinobacter sp. TaxID=50741 RepID=UPI002B272888